MSGEPTDRMKRLYHHLVEHRWGEPADLIVFERSRAAVPGVLEQVHVAIWDADASSDVTSYMTLGMSELPIPKADYRVELTLGVRGQLSREHRSQLATLLANLTEYPFTYQRKIDWWERLVNPGARADESERVGRPTMSCRGRGAARMERRRSAKCWTDLGCEGDDARDGGQRGDGCLPVTPAPLP